MIYLHDSTFDCPHCKALKMTFDTIQSGVTDSRLTENFELETTEHALFRCRGCKEISYFQFTVIDESRGPGVPPLKRRHLKFQYPGSTQKLPDFVPAKIANFYKEAGEAYSFGLFTSASAMCRRTIYEICDRKKVIGKDYKDKIKNLGLDKRITDPLLKIKGMGDESLHSNPWDSVTIQKALKALELIIHYLFIAEEHIKDFSKQHTKEDMARKKLKK